MAKLLQGVYVKALGRLHSAPSHKKFKDDDENWKIRTGFVLKCSNMTVGVPSIFTAILVEIIGDAKFVPDPNAEIYVEGHLIPFTSNKGYDKKIYAMKYVNHYEAGKSEKFKKDKKIKESEKVKF